MSIGPSYSTQLVLHVVAYINSRKDTTALHKALLKHDELVRGADDLATALQSSVQLREDVASAIMFAPDEFDTILAMIDALPEREWLRKIPGVTDLRGQLVNALSGAAVDLLSCLNLPASAFFDQVWSQWYPPSKAIAAHATKHTQTYTRLIETLGANPMLRFLDQELFSKSGLPPVAGAPTPEQDRVAFYFCISLIQLLEDVYIDFNLDLESQKNHPHVQGWITLYAAWVKQPTIQKTWNGVFKTYNSHFRAFWNELVLKQVDGE